MLVGAIGDTPYRIMLLVHIAAAMVAFAPVFVHTLMNRQLSAGAPNARSAVSGLLVKNARMVYGPALLVAGVAGFGLAGMSDKVFKMSQTWLVVAFVVWVAMNGVLHAVVLPAEKALAGGDTKATGKSDMGSMVLAVLLVIMLVLMIWKPGA